jgi:hypothetical protein
VAGTTALSADATTLTFTPSAALPAGATVTATLSGVQSTAGVALATRTWTFTTAGAASGPTVSTLFGSQTPSVLAATDDGSPVELGVKFTPTANGTVTAIRFFKGATNTGTHIGHLWTASGARLATVTFTGESATGWQSATLSTPVALTAGTSYVVSYFAPKGNYSYTPAYFSAPVTSGALTAPTTGNGLYAYGGSGGFPTYSYNATNYFVDVEYTTTSSGSGGGTTTPPATPTTVSLHDPTDSPVNESWNDANPITVGTRFSSSAAGSVSAIKVYVGPGNTGPHPVSLWTAAGVQIGSGSSTTETADGWQTILLAEPVVIQPNTEYRAAAYLPSGMYSIDLGALANPTTSGVLSTPASGGVYAYGTGFPSNAVTHDYWVDVVFTPAS